MWWVGELTQPQGTSSQRNSQGRRNYPFPPDHIRGKCSLSLIVARNHAWIYRGVKSTSGEAERTGRGLDFSGKSDQTKRI